MAQDKPLAEWARRLLAEDAAGGPTPAGEAAAASGLTAAARELLRAVDAGGVPLFVTENLRRIAAENGIESGDDWTPNRIIDALRAKAARR